MEIQYIRVGDYFIPDLTLPEETRPMGKWGRMHREYLREHKPIQYNCLLLSGKLWTYLADLNEAQEYTAVTETVYNALELTQLSAFQEAGFSDSVYIGIIANTPRLAACQDYLDYLISIG